MTSKVNRSPRSAGQGPPDGGVCGGAIMFAWMQLSQASACKIGDPVAAIGRGHNLMSQQGRIARAASWISLETPRVAILPVILRINDVMSARLQDQKWAADLAAAHVGIVKGKTLFQGFTRYVRS